MREKLKALHDLQTIDLALAKARKVEAAIDDGSAKMREVEFAKQTAEKADKDLLNLSTELKDKELNLKTIETKQKTFKDKLYSGKVTNPKELESIEMEIQMLGRQKGKLEERILGLFDEIEQQKEDLTNKKAEFEKQETELKEYLEKLRADRAEISAKIQQLTADRQNALPHIDAVLLKKYEAMHVRLGGIAVCKVESNNCSACNTNIHTGVMNEIHANKTLATCENCGRLLYLE